MKSTALCLTALLAVACAKESTGSSAKPAVDEGAPATDPAPAAGKTAAPPPGVAPTAAVPANKAAPGAISGNGTIAETSEFVLSLEAPAQLGVGEVAKVVFTVTPKKGWKLNEEFPPKLKVEPPEGVEIDKPNQGKTDAVTYTIHEAKWALSVKPTAAGKKTVSGNLKFAVCTETTCNPRKPALAFAFDVK